MSQCLYSGNFNRNILLARSNIRKAKGQTAAIIALVLLSSVMMNLWLMLSTDYKKNFDRYHDKLNDGHVNVAAYTADDDFREYATDLLENSADVTEFSIDDAFCAPVSFEYNGGKTSVIGVLLEKDAALSRSVGKYEITEDSAFTSGIYLPMLYGTGGNYSAGDTVELELFGEKYEYTVCGFFNSTMSGSANCLLMSFLLTEDKFKEFSEEAALVRSTYISVRIVDKSKSEELGTWLKEKLGEEFPSARITENDYEFITTSRYISQMICAGIMSAMAFLVLLIGIVVISSNVANYIRENMRNLGALKGIGYTSGQLISALILQFSGISAVAAMIGAAFSYCIFPGVNEMMIAQTGIPYEVKFLPLPFIITVLFILCVTAA
ncbi:MAG: ABC transporter permease, partial [Oscillospiraceae bacterium]|nr:ABC transporter permease [Oscillospiraceae bacterium]